MKLPNVLVVDDNDGIRESVRDLLEKEGWPADTADSGQAALEKLAQKRYSLVVTDLSMPGMDGIQLAAQCRKDHPLTDVILMTAVPSLGSAIASMRGSLVDYLLKPVNPTALQTSLSRWWRERLARLKLELARDALATRLVAIRDHLDKIAAGLKGAPLKELQKAQEDLQALDALLRDLRATAEELAARRS